MGPLLVKGEPWLVPCCSRDAGDAELEEEGIEASGADFAFGAGGAPSSGCCCGSDTARPPGKGIDCVLW